jgi:translocation and assembly module TamA
VVASLFCIVTLSGAQKKDEALNELPLYVEGLHFIALDALLDALDAKRAPSWMFWKDHTPKVKAGLMRNADTTLRSFFDSEGFYDANATIIVSDDNVTLKIHEGKPVRVADINITSDYNITDIVTFKPGDIFRAADFIAVKQRIADALLKEGYCSYDLDTKAYVYLSQYRVNLRYLLTKGEPCVFGKATIKGLETIDERIVQSRVRAKEGKRFNKELVQETSTAIYGLQSFDSVIINVNRKLYNVVPVDIKVEEMERPYHIEFGAGYDTYVGPRVHMKFVKHNFTGNAKQLSFELLWSSQEKLLQIDFYKPVLINIEGFDIDFGASTGYSDLEFDGFREKKSWIKTFLKHETARLSLTAGMALEAIEIDYLDEGVCILPCEAYDTFLLAYPYADIVYDRRDSKLNPKYGYYIAFYTEFGLPTDAESSLYWKNELELRGIYTIADLTMAVVAKAGSIKIEEDSYRGIPESKKFFGGGAYSNRAYGYRELGVITSATTDKIDGALSMLNLSVEFDYPIQGNLYGAVFSDNTMLNADSYDFSGDIITSVGVGVRYMTPVGPFKLDVAFNVHDPSQYGIIFQIGQSF